MDRIRRAIILLIMVGFTLLASGSTDDGQSSKATAAPPGTTPLLRKVTTFDLPGPPGKRFDYLTIIPERHLLLATHLGAGRLYVIDLASNKVVNVIEDLPGIEAVQVAPDLDKAYTSNWGEHKVGVIDLKQMRVVKKLTVENKPDGIAYAAPFHKIYVSDERAKAEVVIDAVQDRVLKTIRFQSETGVPQYDSVSRKVVVNLQDEHRIAEIDPATDAVVNTYAVSPCRGNHGMAIDAEHRRAFLACEDNDTMAVFDLDAHKVIASFPMPPGADVVTFDSSLGRIYVACGSGAIAVFQQDDPGHYRKLADVPVEKKVHSIVADPATHLVYAPEEQENGKPVSRMAVYSTASSANDRK